MRFGRQATAAGEGVLAAAALLLEAIDHLAQRLTDVVRAGRGAEVAGARDTTGHLGLTALGLICPGPIDSSITRDAPPALKPLVDAVLGAVFPSPESAARAVVYLAAAPEIAGDTGVYTHALRRKHASPSATDSAYGAALYARGEELLAPYLGGLS